MEDLHRYTGECEAHDELNHALARGTKQLARYAGRLLKVFYEGAVVAGMILTKRNNGKDLGVKLGD